MSVSVPQLFSTLTNEPRALESVLLSVLSALEAEMVFIRNLVGGLLAELDDNIDRDRFKRLLHYSRRLASFQSRAKLVSAPVWYIISQLFQLRPGGGSARRGPCSG